MFSFKKKRITKYLSHDLDSWGNETEMTSITSSFRKSFTLFRKGFICFFLFGGFANIYWNWFVMRWYSRDRFFKVCS